MASRGSSVPPATAPVTSAAAASSASHTQSEQPAVNQQVVNYPEGVFRSGGTKAVFARRGTSLLALAEVYRLRLSKLLAYNDLATGDDFLSEDRLIYLQRPRHRTDVNEQKKERWEPFKSMTGISSLISRRRS